jgi:hypothetical protein
LVATFHSDERTKPVKGEFGPELAMVDAAGIRAGVFAMFMQTLVNSKKVDLGEDG